MCRSESVAFKIPSRGKVALVASSFSSLGFPPSFPSTPLGDTMAADRSIKEALYAESLSVVVGCGGMATASSTASPASPDMLLVTSGAK
jgi:hypothetical protein